MSPTAATGRSRAVTNALVQTIICAMAVLKLSASMSSPTFLIVSCSTLRWLCRRGTSCDFGGDGPFALLILLHDQPPDAGEEAVNAFDALRAPGLHLFQRAHEHFVKPQRIGAVLRDDVVRVDHVAARLGHLLPVLAEDQALVDQLLRTARASRRGRDRTAPCARSARRAGAARRARCRRRRDRHRRRLMLEFVSFAFRLTFRHPVPLGFAADEALGVPRIEIAQVIPATARPLRHGVRSRAWRRRR